MSNSRYKVVSVMLRGNENYCIFHLYISSDMDIEEKLQTFPNAVDIS